MRIRIISAAIAASIAFIIGAGAGSASAATTPAPVSASTVISARPDSGVQGNNWAKDNFTRVATIQRVSGVTLADCGGVTDTGHCYLWKFTLADTGHFTTIAGQLAPRTGTLERQITGTMSGGTTTGTFYVSWKTAKAARVPATENDSAGVTHSTGEWVKQFFGAPAVFGAIDLGNWGWTYTLKFGSNTQCPNNAYRWIDANPDGGAVPADGNILTPSAPDC